jgi:hypothetical protein
MSIRATLAAAVTMLPVTMTGADQVIEPEILRSSSHQFCLTSAEAGHGLRPLKPWPRPLAGTLFPKRRRCLPRFGGLRRISVPANCPCNPIKRDAAPTVELKHSRMLLQVRPGTGEGNRQAIVDEWYRTELKKAVPSLIAKWEPLLGVKVDRFPESKKSFLIGEKVSLVNQVIEKPIIAYLLFRQC